MGVFLTLVWFLAGAIAGWGFTSLRAATTVSHARQQMRREIRHWQSETERYKAVADRHVQDKAAWTAGCRQGRDDVITIVPLLIAAQQRLLFADRKTEPTEMDDCA
jgi:hypothetical protein